MKTKTSVECPYSEKCSEVDTELCKSCVKNEKRSYWEPIFKWVDPVPYYPPVYPYYPWYYNPFPTRQFYYPYRYEVTYNGDLSGYTVGVQTIYNEG